MVRVGAKRRLELDNSPTTAKPKKSPLGKRTKTPASNNNDLTGRSSKRSRTSAIPYQTPESINIVLKAISSAHSTRTTLPQHQKKLSKPSSPPKPSNKPVIKKAKASIKTGKSPIKKSSIIKTPNKRAINRKKKSILLANQVVSSSQQKSQKQKKTLAAKLTRKIISTPKTKKEKTIKKPTPKQQSTTVQPSKLKEKKASKKASNQPKNQPPQENEEEDDAPGIGNKKRKSKKESLNPKPNVTLYEKDPTFHSNLEIPYISTLAQTRLVYRAIQMNDSHLLKKLVTASELSKIYSLCIPRSIMGDNFNQNNSDALALAVQLGNKDAIKILLGLDPALESKFGPSPDLLIQSESTGRGSHMMFGHGLRAVTVGRGGKEGHAALLKDESFYSIDSRIQQSYNFHHIIHGIENGMRYEMLEYVLTLYNKERESSIMNALINNVDSFVRHGNVEVAGKLAARGLKHGGYGFNFLHVEALSNTVEPFSTFKPVSVVKKSMSGARLTPLHCAAANPNPSYLQTLLNSRPEYSIVDRQNWMPIHYAAVCVGDGPLKLLLNRGVSTLVAEKDGNTPLLLAVLRGRLQNVKAIISHEMQNVEGSVNQQDRHNDDDEDDAPIPAAIEATSSLEKVNKHGLRPLHAAAQNGNIEIVKALLKAKADPERFTPAQFEKLTPLMIACLHGNLDVVRLLINHGVKVAVVDRRGRTAIFHAVINGHAHVLSYLIRLGVSTDVKDSSGNTLAHYAAAYGWYFALKLLLEAGCDVVKGNDWKLTPIAIAFMKGHIGIVEMLVKEPGVEVNTPVDGDTGMTLLLTACSSTTMKSSLIPRLKFLVDELGADCTTPDFKGNNALHYLAGHTLNKEWKEFATMLKNLSDAVKFLIDHGCNSNVPNLQNETPLMIACYKGNYWIAEKFIEYGVKLDSLVDSEYKENVLHKLVRASNSHVQHLYEKLSKDADNLKALKEMAQCKNAKGMTPLFKLISDHKSPDLETIPHIVNFVTFLVKKLDSDVNATLIIDNNIQSSTIIHEVVMTNYATKVIPILQSSKTLLMLDPLDKNLQTPLASVIMSRKQQQSDVEVASFLIKAGANVNFQCKQQQLDRDGIDKQQQQQPLGLLLLLAMRQPSMYSLIPEMIAKRGDFRQLDPKTHNSVLHFVSRNPNQPAAFEAIKALIRAGANVNLPNKNGRTSLHLTVNARGKETDVAYDIEDFLLTSGADLRLKDIRGRTPLHYAFVKIGQPLEKSHLDPIELVMILLNSIKGANIAEFVKITDSFGATALHYGAMRGATICCSYFTSEMKGGQAANVDIKDMRGNTPFGLAVWCGHEGSSLHFQQLGANFLQILDTNIQLIQLSDGDNDDDAGDGNVVKPKKSGSNNGSNNSDDQDSNNNASSDDDDDNDDDNNDEDNNSPNEDIIYKKSMRKLLATNSPSSNKKKESITIINEWVWAHKTAQENENRKMILASMKYPVFQEVVKKEWQGILHLMIGKLQQSSSAGSNSMAIPVCTAIKTQKLRLALKLIHRVKDVKELEQRDETLLHTLAKYSPAAAGSGPQQNEELQIQVLKELVGKGVDPKRGDSLGCNALSYAAMNHNYPLVKAFQQVGLTFDAIPRLARDQLGRNPFSALFWKLYKFINIPQDLTKWAASLLSSGGGAAGNYANELTKYPFLLSPYPGVRCLVLYDNDNDAGGGKVFDNYKSFPLYSPLIVAVLHGRYEVVKWLLCQTKSSVNVNFGDGQGRTAMMHAIRLNDLRMVKLLLNPNSYNVVLDKDPWNANYSNWSVKGKSTSELNLNTQDKIRGWTAVDDLVSPSLNINGGHHANNNSPNDQSYSYKNVEPILTILHKAGASFTNKSGDGKSPLERAVQDKKFHIVNIMHKLLKTSQNQPSCPPYYGEVDSYPNLGSTAVIKNFTDDTKKIAAEKTDKIPPKGLAVIPDPLLKMEADNSEVVLDSDQNNIPFDCVLTQVDLAYGLSGLYNFYKMQVVKQPRGKQLVVLFTQWGRVGMEGQYQKTPFPTEEEAIKEFKKIFKAKTGNNWDEKDTNFTPLPKRYRLVHKDMNAKRPAELTVDFDKLECGEQKYTSTTLNAEVYKVIRNLTMTHKIGMGSHNSRHHQWRNPSLQNLLEVNQSLPIISTEALHKADQLLNRIKVILAEKYQMHCNHYSSNYSEEERLKIFDKLIEASEEFYTLVPVYGFDTKALLPIFEFSALSERQEEIYRLIHLGFAKELILAAEYNSSHTNPFEYIYRCLGTKLTGLDMRGVPGENYEGQLILQYIHCSSPKTVVEGIYRIQGAEEHDELTMDNRWLLWHGTKPENVLSVLHTGLQIAPLGVDRMGELFGKGIYFADTFGKSESYATGSSGGSHSSKFIFICEVALGNVKNIRLNDDEYANHSLGTEKTLQKGFDSLKTADSRYIPDPANTIMWNGKAIPLGAEIEQEFPENQYPGLNYNEYIIFNPKQVKLRYMIQFK